MSGLARERVLDHRNVLLRSHRPRPVCIVAYGLAVAAAFR
jgi:hypothetical protein